MNESEKEIGKIVIHYTDGSTSEISKGFIANIEDSKTEGKSTITFEMVGISGRDLVTVVEGVVQLGMRMGMFGDSESDE